MFIKSVVILDLTWRFISPTWGPKITLPNPNTSGRTRLGILICMYLLTRKFFLKHVIRLKKLKNHFDFFIILKKFVIFRVRFYMENLGQIKRKTRAETKHRKKNWKHFLLHFSSVFGFVSYVVCVCL